MSNTPLPALGFTFVLEVDSVQIAYFSEVSGIGSTIEATPVNVVDNKGQRQLLRVSGQVKWENITFKRGLDGSTYLQDWRKQVVEGKFKDARRNGAVVVQDTTEKEVCRFEFVSGWPVSWKTGAFNVTSNDVLTEELEIAHEGLTLKSKV